MLALKSMIDERGMLVAIENGPDLPFAINRLFYMSGMLGAPRGFHAHRTLHELLVCPTGSCRVVVDDGKVRREHILNRSDEALYVPPLFWLELHDFSKDCVALVLASAAYDESDYIRDYSDFLAETENAGTG